MALVAGIDPGTNGALAIYDTNTRGLLSVVDLPTWNQTVGKKKRKRIDVVGLMELYDELHMLGVELIVIEAVGGRPRQSASAAFVFGYVVGLLMAMAMDRGLMVETVPPQNWKKIMRVPGKAGGKDKTNAEKKLAQEAIVQRANEMFPADRDMFKTERGAMRMDRAEAAMLAKFGGDYVMERQQGGDIELKMVYRNAETGA